MLLFFVYYHRSNGEIFNESICIDEQFTDRGAYEESDDCATDLYNLKVKLFCDYHGDEYKEDVTENQEQFEEVFDEFFEYNYWIIDSLEI